MSLIKGYFLPHPPIIVKGIGNESDRQKAGRTVENMELIGKEISHMDFETLIIITPHGPVFQDAITINTMTELKGSLKQFGLKDKEFIYSNDLDLVDIIIKKARNKGLSVAELNQSLEREYRVTSALDHGATVPLSFINKANFSLIHITMGLLSIKDLYSFGMIMEEAITGVGKKVVIIASGDLSHRLTQGAPSGYHSSGHVFDKELIDNLDKYNPKAIMEIDCSLRENAGECGYRTLIILLGAFDRFNVSTRVYSYEGPFGVGYGIVELIPLGMRENSIYNQYIFEEEQKLKGIKDKESPYVSLAREALETFIRKGFRIKGEKNLEGKPAGTFVSLKKNGQLRGCIGTIEPTSQSLEEEIIKNAIQAGTEDPRFFPVEEDELDEITYSVDVLGEKEPVASIEDLNPREYGVIVSKGFKRGLLLPDLEGIDTPQEQVRIASQKAGLKPGERDIKLERFRVYRHK